MTPPRPALVCDALLAALDASDGRRQADPDPDAFEAWLLDRCLSSSPDASTGALRAMAREVIDEWRLAAASADFRAWLAAGAPSDDRFLDV